MELLTIHWQQIKYETRKPAGLLQPLPVTSSPWEDISLDFIMSLPPSHGYTTILVVVDRFTKGAHFGALPSLYMAHKVASLFLDMVCKLHGFLPSLVFYRDPIFVGNSGVHCSPFAAVGSVWALHIIQKQMAKLRFWIEPWSSIFNALFMILQQDGLHIFPSRNGVIILPFIRRPESHHLKPLTARYLLPFLIMYWASIH